MTSSAAGRRPDTEGPIRVATWNLERAGSRSWRRAPLQQRRMADVDADIWVLTETHTDRSPGDGYHGVHCPPHPVRRPNPTERWTAIWSRWPITALEDPAPHRRGSVSARVETPHGPLVVHGCVIPWAHEPSFDDGSPARMWEMHLAEIANQRERWRRLRERNPGVPVVVAGDFNQARSGRPRSYGTDEGREAVTEALDAADLQCLTEADMVEAGRIGRSHVLHICASTDLEPIGPMQAWDRTDVAGSHLSDHPTIAVDLRLSSWHGSG